MILPTLTTGSTIEKMHCQGHQRHRCDVYQPRFDSNADLAVGKKGPSSYAKRVRHSEDKTCATLTTSLPILCSFNWLTRFPTRRFRYYLFRKRVARDRRSFARAP